MFSLCLRVNPEVHLYYHQMIFSPDFLLLHFKAKIGKSVVFQLLV